MESLNNACIFSQNGFTYRLIKGKPLYCVPTCLKMVFDSMGFSYTVEKIASYFQIVTPQEASSDNDIGIHLCKGSFSDILSDLRVPLKEEYIPVNYIDSDLFEETLMGFLQQKAHILCGYSYGILFNDFSLKDIGHASIISCVEKNTIGIINPGPDNYGLNYVDDYALYQAIRYKHAGLWIFRTEY